MSTTPIAATIATGILCMLVVTCTMLDTPGMEGRGHNSTGIASKADTPALLYDTPVTHFQPHYMLLPWLPIGSYFSLSSLPFHIFITMLVITIIYIVAGEVTKKMFFRRIALGG